MSVQCIRMLKQVRLFLMASTFYIGGGLVSKYKIGLRLSQVEGAQ